MVSPFYSTSKTRAELKAEFLEDLRVRHEQASNRYKHAVLQRDRVAENCVVRELRSIIEFWEGVNLLPDRSVRRAAQDARQQEGEKQNE